MKRLKQQNTTCSLVSDIIARQAWKDLERKITILLHSEKYSLKTEGDRSAFEDSHELTQFILLKQHSTYKLEAKDTQENLKNYLGKHGK